MLLYFSKQTGAHIRLSNSDRPGGVNSSPLTASSMQCGCQCTKCCFFSDEVYPANRTLGDPPCYFGEDALELCTPSNRPDILGECKAWDESKCGVEFSVPQQMSWCEIPHPMEMPAFVPVGALLPQIIHSKQSNQRSARAVFLLGAC